MAAKINTMKKISLTAGSVLMSAALCFGIFYGNVEETPDLPPLVSPSNFVFSFTSGNIAQASQPFEAIITALPLGSSIDVSTLIPPTPSLPVEMPKIPTDKTEIIGVLPPNVAIIQRGSETYTVKRGEKSVLGYISEISRNGVVIDGEHIPYERG